MKFEVEHWNNGTEELTDAVSKKRPTSLRLLFSPYQLEDLP